MTRDLVQVRGGPGLRHDADARQDDRRHDGTVRQEGHQGRDVKLTRMFLGLYSIHTFMYYINIFHIYINKQRYFLEPGDGLSLRIYCSIILHTLRYQNCYALHTSVQSHQS